MFRDTNKMTKIVKYKKIIDGAVTVIPSSAQLRQETMKRYVMCFSNTFFANIWHFSITFRQKLDDLIR